jgi:GTP-binding protein
MFYDSEATDHKLNEYSVLQDKRKFYIEGRKIDGLVQVADLRDYQSVAHLMRVLKSMGVFNRLESEGAKEGDVVNICGVEFEYSPETMVIT